MLKNNEEVLLPPIKKHKQPVNRKGHRRHPKRSHSLLGAALAMTRPTGTIPQYPHHIPCEGDRGEYHL